MGTLDPAFNHDLKDITKNYADAAFLVVEDSKAQRIVGSGALGAAAREGVAELARMSVAKSLRRAGLGTRILQTLIDHARALGLHQVVLQTTETWTEVLAFYQRFGFRITHHKDGDGDSRLISHQATMELRPHPAWRLAHRCNWN